MEKIDQCLKFRQWKQSLEKNEVVLSSFKELATVRKRDGKVLFSMLEFEGRTTDGEKLLPVVLLRGSFVAVLTIFIEKETGNRLTLLVGQRRVANGELFWETPAGMMDSDTDPVAVALKELEEETGFIAARADIKPLYDKMIYSSPGLMDEGGYMYYAEFELSSKEIESWNNREGGDGGENEHIITKVVPLDEADNLLQNAHGNLMLLKYLLSKK